MKPKKYIKKPIIIEAMQFDRSYDCFHELTDFITNQCTAYRVEEGKDVFLEIETREGTMRASEGDYIIKGIKGEYYPCKPDIFEATYEEA